MAYTVRNGKDGKDGEVIKNIYREDDRLKIETSFTNYSVPIYDGKDGRNGITPDIDIYLKDYKLMYSSSLLDEDREIADLQYMIKTLVEQGVRDYIKDNEEKFRSQIPGDKGDKGDKGNTGSRGATGSNSQSNCCNYRTSCCGSGGCG